MALLCADENFPMPVVETLRSMGHDVLTMQESGQDNQALSDDKVLASAARGGRTLLTLNRKHFIRLHEVVPDHAGLIVCTFDADFSAQAQRIHDALTQEGMLTGKLIRINRPG